MQQRVFYDVAAPRMLSEAEVLSLTPAECVQASTQIDANLVGVLQEIDASLADAHKIITQRILPAVQRYGDNSQQIWESVKFWKSFFEASANTKLNDPYTGDDSIRSDHTTVPATGERDGHGHGHGHGEGDALGSADASIAFSRASPSPSTSGSTPATPRPWSADISPFAALAADLARAGVPSSASTNASLVAHTQREMAQIRKAHHLDSLDLDPHPADDSAAAAAAVPVPEFETLRGFDSYLTTSAAAVVVGAKGKGRAFAFSPAPDGSPAPRLKAGASSHHPLLLQTLLRNHTSSPAPSRGRPAYPPGVSPGWSGLADLSLGTPLSAFASPAKRRADQSELSPPGGGASLLSSFALSPAPTPARTPAKAAARGLARDLYDFAEDSPMPSPPSAVKHYGTRTFDFALSDPALSDPDDEDEDEDELERAQGAPLADFGGGTTARIDDLLAEHSFAKIVDDDDDRPPLSHSFDEGPSYTTPLDASFDDDDHDEGLSRVLGAGPEDTLFGLGQHPRAGAGQHRALDEGEDGGFADEGASRFRVLGNVEETLHGGLLLDSEPFEASPLAGRHYGR